MSQEVHKVGDDFIRIVHQPGNGTRYEVIGARLPSTFPEYAGCWLISFPSIGASHIFREKSFLAMSYVAEKLAYQRNGVKVCEVDLHEMAKCISTITGGQNDAATDKKGYLPSLRIAR
jgi:hypothetical protein